MELALEQDQLTDDVYNWWEDQLRIGEVPDDNYIEIFNSIPLENGTQNLSPRIAEINENLAECLNNILRAPGRSKGSIWHHEEDLTYNQPINLDMCKNLWRCVKKYIADATY